MRSHIDHMLAKGVDGIFVLGTTGEFYALDESEKQQVVAAAVEHCRGRSPVFVGTGAETTREVVRLTRMAEKEGADGVSVITPYFIKPNQAELILESLRERGVPVAYVPFAGEQHGFRRAENIVRAQEAELYFYSRVLGFELPESIEPVEIFNLR